MSKPLKLTIHPRLEDTNLSADDIRQGRLTTHRLAGAKRLTDAELAAEYHAASAASWAARAFSKTRVGRDMGYRELAVSEDNRMDTLHRFAAAPHYFEADQ